MLVEIRPIPFNNKWHGVSEGENQFTMPKVYEVYYNEKTGKYDSGLTEDEKKKFEKELGIDLSDVFIPDQREARKNSIFIFPERDREGREQHSLAALLQPGAATSQLEIG